MDDLSGLGSCLKVLSEKLTSAGIHWCLVGGLAVGILSRPRATEDIDLLVLLDKESRTALKDIL